MAETPTKRAFLPKVQQRLKTSQRVPCKKHIENGEK
jgi:hypothetical protein